MSISRGIVPPSPKVKKRIPGFPTVASLVGKMHGKVVEKKVLTTKRRVKNMVVKAAVMKNVARRLVGIERTLLKLEKKFIRGKNTLMGGTRKNSSDSGESDQTTCALPSITDREDIVQNKKRNSIWMYDNADLGEAKTVLLPDDPHRYAHDVIVLLVTFGDIFFSGLIVASRLLDTPPSTGEVVFFILSTIFHCFFMYLSFRTAYLQGWELIGDEADEVSHIAHNYLAGWFKVDILTMIPFDVLLLPFSTAAFNVISTLRFTRLSKVHRLFQLSDPLKEKPPSIILTQFMFIWLVSVHVLACTWLSLGGDPEKDSNAERAYVRSLYFIIATMTTVGYGDVVPDTIAGMAFTSVVMVFGAGMYASALSALGSAIRSTDLLEKETRDRRQCLSAFMTKYDVPLSLRREAHALYPALIERHVYDPVRVTEGLPPWFADKLLSVLRVHLLRKITFLVALDEDVLLRVAENLETRTIDAGVTVVDHGENGTEMFLISRGVCDVFVPPISGNALKWLTKLREGQVFGELGLLGACKRTASVRTATACELYVLSQTIFNEIAAQHPTLRDALVAERDCRRAVVQMAQENDSDDMPNVLLPPHGMRVNRLSFDALHETPEEQESEDEESKNGSDFRERESNYRGDFKNTTDNSESSDPSFGVEEK